MWCKGVTSWSSSAAHTGQYEKAVCFRVNVPNVYVVATEHEGAMLNSPRVSYLARVMDCEIEETGRALKSKWS